MAANVEADDYDLNCEHDAAEGDYSGNVRRPMNAFLIFCKRHRNLVREKYPHLENRSVTKILGELWANLESSEKVTYTELAKQYKEAFMKANPDFKWYKLPCPTFRSSPVTRPTNQRQGPKLEVVATSSSPQQQQQLVASPCGIPLFKLADEAQMGGLSSLINNTTKTPSSQNLMSKPPKKRYLENGAFRSQAFEAASKPSVDVPAPTSSSTSDCSALLKLAEMCSHELVNSGPTTAGSGKPVVVNGHSVGTASSNSTGSAAAAAAASSVTSATVVPSAAAAVPIATATPASSTHNSNTDYGLTDFGKLMASAMRANLAAAGGTTLLGGNLNLFSSPLDRSSAGQDSERSPHSKGAAANEDQPLDLCTEKTITTSHQELIDCIVDTLCRDNETAGGTSKKPPFPSSRLPKGIQSYLDSSGKNNRVAAREMGSYRSASEHDRQSDRSSLTLPLKKIKSARGGDAASTASSPVGAEARGEGGSFSDADDLSPRKSQRSCKGKRYQAMLSEGIIQPAKERKLSSSRKPSVGDDRFGECGDDNTASVSPPRNVRSASPDSRTRTSSDSSDRMDCGAGRKSEQDKSQKPTRTEASSGVDDRSDSRSAFDSLVSETRMDDCSGGSDKDRSMKRFKTGDFDLEVHIAALPECNIVALDRRKQCRQSSSFASGAQHQRNEMPVMKEGLRMKAPSDEKFCEGALSETGDSSGSSSESHGDMFLTGSQKRKARKRSIAHLDPVVSNMSTMEAGVVNNFKLVALAEVCEERMSSGTNQNDQDSTTGSA